MAEVRLVLFAKTALEVMQDVLPAYSSIFSKHTFWSWLTLSSTASATTATSVT